MKCEKCEDCRVLLSALLDGELSEDERAAVMRHLDACEDCRAFFSDLSATHELLVSMGEEDVPEGFSARVMRRVHARRMRGTLRRVSALAACLAVVLIVGGLLASAGLGQSTFKSAENTAAPDFEDAVMDAETPSVSETYGTAINGAEDRAETDLTASGGAEPDANSPDPAPDLTFDPAPAEPTAPVESAKTDITTPQAPSEPAEAPQPVLRLMDTPAAEEFLQQNALPDTLDDTGACVSVDALRELSEEVELLDEATDLHEEILANWAGESTVRVELVPLTEESK